MGRSLLLLVSGFLIIFGIIQNAVQNRQQILAERAPEYYYQEQSRNIAGAMMEVALGNLNSGTTYLTPNSIDDIEIDMLGGVGSIQVDSTTNFQSRVYATISGNFERPDGTSSITDINVKFIRDAFSIYAYFTDVEPEIYFVDGDVLNGPVHTNGEFHIDGDPIFNGPITSASGLYQRSGSNPQFNGGSDFDAGEVELPTEAPEVVELAKVENGGIGQFTDDVYVEFKDNNSNNNTGTVEISDAVVRCVSRYSSGGCYRYDHAPDPETTVTRDLSDFNGVISSTKKVYTKGRVDGQVTIHSKEDVEIMGDLYYTNRKTEENDNPGPITDDRIGIISEESTIVDNNAHSSLGSQDLYIDASILALGESFEVQGHDLPGFRGSLNILGGVIQRERGAVGTFGGRYGTTGYSKNYKYDDRFRTGSTPGFPRKKKFNIESWRESTRIQQP